MVARKKTPQNGHVLCLTTADVRETLVNPWKATGPDTISGRVHRECADQMTDVFIDNFNIFLSTDVTETWF